MVLLACGVLVAIAASTKNPPVALGANNVAGSMRSPAGHPPAVLLLGAVDTAAACEALALATPKATSWTYHHCDFPPARSAPFLWLPLLHQSTPLIVIPNEKVLLEFSLSFWYLNS